MVSRTNRCRSRHHVLPACCRRRYRSNGCTTLRGCCTTDRIRIVCYGGIGIHQKSHEKKPHALANSLSTMSQFARKDERMSSLDMNRRFQTFKIGSTSFIVQSTSITERNQKGPLTLVRMHVQLLSFLLTNIIFDNMRFPFIQPQGQFGTEGGLNGVRDAMDGGKAFRGEGREIATSQRLLGVGVRGILAATDLFREVHQVIAFGRCQATVNDVNLQLFAHHDPVGDCTRTQERED